MSEVMKKENERIKKAMEERGEKLSDMPKILGKSADVLRYSLSGNAGVLEIAHYLDLLDHYGLALE